VLSTPYKAAGRADRAAGPWRASSSGPSRPALDQRLSPAAPPLGSLLSLRVQNQFKKGSY